MKYLRLLIISILMAVIPTHLYTQTMPDYCSIPPFMTRTIPPNIVFILDNSAAMLLPAYPLYDPYDASAPTVYTGYFEPQSSYCAGRDMFYVTSSRCEAGDRGPYPGSLLNWATMSRYDLLMHLLIGGLGVPEPDSLDLNGYGASTGWTKRTPSYPHCDFTMSGNALFITGDGCALQNPGARIIVRNGRRTRGIIPDMVDRNHDGSWDAFAPRISVISSQPWQNDVAMPYCMSATNALNALYRALQNAVPDETSSDLPLGKAIVRTIEFFKNSCPVCNDCADPVDSVPCRRNMVIVASTGESGDIPSPYSAAFIREEIRKAHTEDIRADREGKQLIHFFSIGIFASDSGKDILKGLAQYGGFTDQNGNGRPDLTSEWDQNGDGLPDTYFEASNSASLRSSLERAFSDVSSQAASGTGVSMLSSSSFGAGCMMQSEFSPVHHDDEREVLWTGRIKNLWVDHLNNLREDSTPDHRLILGQDKIVKYYFHEGSRRTRAALFSTLADGSGGSFASCSSPEVRASEEVRALWEGGRKLALRDPSARTIFTSKRLVRGDTVIRTFPDVPYPAFHANMHSFLLSALNPDATYTADAIVRYIRGECLETGVTGDTGCGRTRHAAFRDRRVTVDGVARVWKLGDIMHSTPALMSGRPLHTFHIDYADRSYYDYVTADQYRRRSPLVFVGANDGMLHAFRAGYLKDRGLTGNVKAILKNFFGSGDDEHERLGEEVWAFIPLNAFPYLKYLAQPDYCHVNYSDLTAKVVDVSIEGNAQAARDYNSWKTILIGGMRFGGACGSGGIPAHPPDGAPENIGYSSFFALDVTAPERPEPIWEFSDDDMGYATSAPAVVRIGDRMQNGKWYVVFGSGSKVLPQGGTDIGRNAPGFLYILDLGTGRLEKKISLDHHAVVGDMLAVDTDHDYVTDTVYFGTSYKRGSGWAGKMMSLDLRRALGTSGVTIDWDPSFGSVLFSGNYPFTASPEAAKDSRGNVWIYSGSGKYYSDSDESDASRQIVLGLRERNTPIGESSLYDATRVLTRGQVTGTERICTYDTQSDSFRFRDVVTSIQPSEATLSEVESGWKIYLSDGERVISRPAAVGGLLDFLTYKPDPDPCAYDGETFLYSVAHATGLAPARIAIRAPDTTSGTSGVVTVQKGIRLGIGAPPTGDAILIRSFEDGNENADVRKSIQIATGLIAEAENRPLFSVVSRIVHWLKK